MVTRGVVAVMGVAMLCLVGCTPEQPTSMPTASPPVASPSPTSTRTPTPTGPVWSAEQQAAVAAVEGYYEVYGAVMRLERDPGDLYQVARGNAAEQATKAFNQLLSAGFKAEGTVMPLSLDPTVGQQSGDRVAVGVDVCEDGREWRLLDGDGTDVLGMHAKRVLPVVATVEQWPSDGWFVTQFKAGNHKCAS